MKALLVRGVLEFWALFGGRSVRVQRRGLDNPGKAVSSAPHSCPAALNTLSCIVVIVFLQATGPEDFIEQRCGSRLPPGLGKQRIACVDVKGSTARKGHLPNLVPLHQKIQNWQLSPAARHAAGGRKKNPPFL